VKNLVGKVVILNAPPNSGKDVAAQCMTGLLGKHNIPSVHCEFKDKAHSIAMELLSLTPDEYYSIYNNRELKEKVHSKFFGMSPRNFLQWVSEEVCKPMFGQDYFGKAAARLVGDGHLSVFSDGGFLSELLPIIKKVGAGNVHIVRFARQGCTFKGDTRDFIQESPELAGVHFHNMQNDGYLLDFVQDILKKVKG
tara:strand:+ start:226 stop:810 length:585 start_codon:yes stop_codon:yes gene_type:complete